VDPAKDVGMAINMIEPSMVASRIPTVVLESANHLYRSGRARWARAAATPNPTLVHHFPPAGGGRPACSPLSSTDCLHH
jgi:hypothetical protein